MEDLLSAYTSEKEKRRNTDAAWQPLNFAWSRERYTICVSSARAASRQHAGEEDLNFKFYLIIFEFNFVTCPEGGSPGLASNLCDTHVRTQARARTPVRILARMRIASVYISSPSAQWVVSFYYTPRRKTSEILRSGCSLRAC